MKTRCITAVSLAAVFLLGCGSQVPEPDSNSQSAGLQTVTSKPKRLGFVHSPSKSRFSLGTKLSLGQGHGMVKQIGSNGVIAVTTSGATIAVLDADANKRLRSRGPLSLKPDEHVDFVLKYFVDSGLPSDQVGKKHNHATVTEGGPVGGATQIVDYSYTTIIDRQVDGFRVEGSYAWASFNADGVAIAEEVYWPELPEELITEAKKLKTKHNTERVQLKSLLVDPDGYDEGEVVIHHNPHTDADFDAFASIDYGSKRQAMGHSEAMRFDINGRKVGFKLKVHEPDDVRR